MKPVIHFLTIIFVFVLLPFNFIIGSSEAKKGCKYSESIEKPPIGEIVPPGYLLSKGLLRQMETIRYIRSGGRENKVLFTLNNEGLFFFQSYIDCLKSMGMTPGGDVILLKAYSLFYLGALPESMSAVNEVIQQDPDLKDGYLLKARILIRQEKYNEGARVLEEQMSRFPEDSEFLFFLGSHYMKAENNGRAILYFISLLDVIKNRGGRLEYSAEVIHNLAELYYRTGDSRKAAFYYKLYLKYKNSLNERLILAKLYSHLGKFKEAKRELTSILTENSSRSDIIELLGEIIFIENRYEAYSYLSANSDKIRKGSLAGNLLQNLSGLPWQTEKNIEKFAGNDSGRLAAHLAYLELLEKNKNWEKFPAEVFQTAELSYNYKQYYLASTLAEKMLLLSKNHPEWKISKARILDFIAGCYEDAGSPNRALLKVQEAIAAALEGEDVEKFRLHEAFLYRNPEIANYDQAIRLTQDVLKKNSKNGYAWLLQGIIYYEKKEFQRSMNSLQTAIELENNNATYYYYLALASDGLGKMVETESALKSAIQYNSKYASAYNYLGYYYLTKEKNLEEALSLIKTAVELEPDNASYQDSLGWAYFKLDQIKNAKYHLNLAQQLMSESDGPIDPVVLDHLGDLYFRENDPTNAIYYWKKSLESHKDLAEKKKIEEKIKKIK